MRVSAPSSSSSSSFSLSFSANITGEASSGKAVAAGLVVYGTTEGDLDAKVAAAKDEYDAVKEDCDNE